MAITTSNVYVPGTCNIGPIEIRMRYIMGWLGLVLAVLFGLFTFHFHANHLLRLFIVFPIFMSALGFLQGIFHFCASFGMEGLFNVDSKIGKTESVALDEFRRIDRHKAIMILSYALWIAFVIAVGMVFI